MEGEKKEDKQGKIENLIPIVKAARDHFITAEYGKFDLIQALLLHETLLYSKPRIIKKLICEKFGLFQSEINNDTFWSWLRRIRKSHWGNVSLNKIKQPIEPFLGDKQTVDWKNFTPSTPVMDTETAQTIIKLVTSTE